MDELIEALERADGPWSLDYIPDAATARYTYRDSFGRTWANDASNYDPVECGVHLCGQTDDGEHLAREADNG
jgi:hypothetical protein